MDFEAVYSDNSYAREKSGTKVTVVTLYRDDSSAHFVACVRGELTDQQKDEISESLELDPEDDVGFAIVDLHESPDTMKEFVNIFDENG